MIHSLPDIKLTRNDFIISNPDCEIEILDEMHCTNCVHKIKCDKIELNDTYTGVSIYYILNRYGIYDEHFDYYKNYLETQQRIREIKKRNQLIMQKNKRNNIDIDTLNLKNTQKFIQEQNKNAIGTESNKRLNKLKSINNIK